MICLKESKEGALLAIHAQPGAKQSAIKGMHGDALKVAVKAPPVDGAANEAIRDLLAETFAIPASRIALKAGATARKKVFLLASLPYPEAKRILEGALP